MNSGYLEGYLEKTCMKAALVFITWIYISLIVETTWCVFCGPSLLHLDLIPALICWYALNDRLSRGALWVIGAGFLASLFSSLKFFLFPFSYLTAFLTVYFIRSNVLELTRFHAYLITAFISVEILVIQLAGSGNPELLWPWGLIQAGLNMAVAPVVFWICDRSLFILSEIVSKFHHEK